MFDVAIIGAGPAGSTLARLIGRSRRVLLLDRRRLDAAPGAGRRGKCCGGLLAPDAQRMLAELGLGLPGGVLIGPQLFAVRSIDLPSGLERFYQRHYINLDRERFDRWLISLVPGQVDLRTGAQFAAYERVGGGFAVRFVRAGRSCTERARVIVGADGAGSLVRRLAIAETRPSGIVPPLPSYFAIQEWLRSPDPLPYYSALFDPELTDFYSWTIPKDDLLVVGSALRSGRGVRARLERLKATLIDCGYRLGPCARREAAWVNRPLHPRHLFLGADGVALVGESAGWISPSSAEGFSYAFASARDLAAALSAGPEGLARRYALLTRPLRRNILLKGLKGRVIYSGLLRRAVLRTGVGSFRVGRFDAAPSGDGMGPGCRIAPEGAWQF